MGFLGDFDLAEEAAQDAFAIAAERWERDGPPQNPRAWLIATARNRAIDRLRRNRVLARKEPLLRTLTAPTGDEEPIEAEEHVTGDERLELIFMCCHPALATDAQVALTLRAFGGLETDEIARAFLVSPETMKRRLSRAKGKIRATRIPFAIPREHLLPDRLQAVLAVLYLIYNEGYGGRTELAAEAIRLGTLLARLMPDEGEVCGLLALMHFHHARRDARFAGGELVLLSEQDRSLWDEQEIGAARELLQRALALRGSGAYVLHAAIASLHADAEPDWGEIGVLYARLAELTRSPIVELNRAVAVAQAGDAAAALALVDALDLDGYPYLHSTRGELLSRLDRGAEARAAYGRALELTTSDAERRFLSARIAQL